MTSQVGQLVPALKHNAKPAGHFSGLVADRRVCIRLNGKVCQSQLKQDYDALSFLVCIIRGCVFTKT